MSACVPVPEVANANAARRVAGEELLQDDVYFRVSSDFVDAQPPSGRRHLIGRWK